MPENQKNILVVDDDTRWRRTVVDILTEAGYSVSDLDRAPDPVPPCRAAILDVSLDPNDSENRDGLALARKLAPAPVILLTGVPDSELAEFQHGNPNILGRIDKTGFGREDLLNLLRRALGTEASGSSRILIVEDDPGWQSVYADILEDSGYQLQNAVSYGEARGHIQRTKFDAAVVDLHLVSSADPEENRDGFSLLRITNQRGLPTVVVSALGAPDDIDRAYDEFGVFAFMEKEAFDRQAFARTLADAIQAGAEALQAPAAVATPTGPDPLTGLTDREREVLALLAQGHTNRQIAEILTITPNTVKKHVDHVLQKLGVSTRSAAAAIAVRAGLGK